MTVSVDWGKFTSGNLKDKRHKGPKVTLILDGYDRKSFIE